MTGSNFKLEPVDNDYVFKELKQLNESKSTGLDDIFPQFLKDGADILKLSITHMVNLLINSCIVPNDLKTVTVTPLYKRKLKWEVGITVYSKVNEYLD